MRHRHVDTAKRYYASFGGPLHEWSIIDSTSHRTVDVARTALAAAASVDALNAGRARINGHAALGCRVVLAVA